MRKLYVGILSVCLGICPIASIVMATPSTTEDLQTKQQNSLSLQVQLQSDKQGNGVETKIDGANVSIAKVGKMVSGGGVVTYHIGDKEYNNLSAEESEKLARELVPKTKPQKTAVTDANGLASFPNLEEGIYLVWETKGDGVAAMYEMFTPYLIDVPQSGNNTVISYPKISPKAVSATTTPETTEATTEEPKKPQEKKPVNPKKVQTGDIGRNFTILAVGCLGIAAIVGSRKKKEEKETKIKP